MTCYVMLMVTNCFDPVHLSIFDGNEISDMHLSDENSSENFIRQKAICNVVIAM